MFADSWIANAVVFALGQAAAWAYLRTGLVRRGVVLMVVGWVLVDVALVLRLASDARPWHVACLVAMQVMSLGAVVHFLVLWLRRRSPVWRARRDSLFEQAFVHYLRDELDPAARIWRDLQRRDPWDLEATLSLATVLARRGERARATSLLRSARSLDAAGGYRDVIGEELGRVARASVPRAG